MTIRVREKTTREEWLAWRKSNINASEIGALMGIDKKRSPLQVYYDKKGQDFFEGNEMTEGGLDLEPGAINAVARRHPDWRIETGSHYYDDQDLRIGCTPDAFVWEPGREGFGIIQAKIVAGPTFDEEWERKDNGFIAPLKFQLQTVIEAKMTGASWCYLAPYVVSAYRREPLLDEVPILEGAWEEITAEIAHFWDEFERGLAPMINPELDDDLIKSLYPVHTHGKVLDLRGDNELPAWVAEEAELAKLESMANAQIKPLKEKRDKLRTLIRAKFLDAERIIFQGGEGTCKTVFRKASQSRVMQIKQVGAR